MPNFWTQSIGQGNKTAEACLLCTTLLLPSAQEMDVGRCLSHRPSHGLGVLKTHPFSPLEDSRLPSDAVCSRTRHHMIATIARGGLVNVAKTQTVERDASACCWGLRLAKNHYLPWEAQRKMANPAGEYSICLIDSRRGKGWSEEPSKSNPTWAIGCRNSNYPEVHEGSVGGRGK